MSSPLYTITVAALVPNKCRKNHEYNGTDLIELNLLYSAKLANVVTIIVPVIQPCVAFKYCLTYNTAVYVYIEESISMCCIKYITMYMLHRVWPSDHAFNKYFGTGQFSLSPYIYTYTAFYKR